MRKRSEVKSCREGKNLGWAERYIQANQRSDDLLLNVLRLRYSFVFSCEEEGISLLFLVVFYPFSRSYYGTDWEVSAWSEIFAAAAALRD